MGLYDTILVPCPECGEEYPAQSKSGDRILYTYKLDEAPYKELIDVNRHAPFTCECGCKFKVDIEIHAKRKPVKITNTQP